MSIFKEAREILDQALLELFPSKIKERTKHYENLDRLIGKINIFLNKNIQSGQNYYLIENITTNNRIGLFEQLINRGVESNVFESHKDISLLKDSLHRQDLFQKEYDTESISWLILNGEKVWDLILQTNRNNPDSSIKIRRIITPNSRK